MATKSVRPGKQAAKVKKDLQEMGATVRDVAEERLEQAGEMAAEYCEEGRAKVRSVACACEHFLRERPLTSVLMAAGIGWLVGRFWNRS